MNTLSTYRLNRLLGKSTSFELGDVVECVPINTQMLRGIDAWDEIYLSGNKCS